MSGTEVLFLAAQVLGGLALFIFGMKVMSEALQRAAGPKLRELLFHVTHNRLAGLAVGTFFGTFIHSSATTVMMVGFINAGLMTLGQSVAVMLGANFGTTLSMQLVSLRLGEYSYAAIAVGFMLHLVGPRDLLKHVGGVIFGFGLLFLGMTVMSDGVTPLKGSGALQDILGYADATTLGGALLGVLAATLVTGVIQSSGAAIGMLFALATAGVFTDIRQVFPLVLGAHVGTCATALLGCIGTNIDARRAALSHLMFNVLGALLAVAMRDVYLWILPHTATDLTHQIANAHTMVQGVGVLLVLPVTGAFARVVVALSPSKAKPPEPSHLEERYLDMPEAAIVAAMRETQRMAGLARHTLVTAMRGFVHMEREPFAGARKSEQAVNEIKRQVLRYLFRIAAHDLSRRQSLMVQHLVAAATDIERIGDHASVVIDLVTDKVDKKIWFDDESMRQLVDQYCRADDLLRLTAKSLDPTLTGDLRRSVVSDMLQRRDEYVRISRALREAHRDRVLGRKEDALTAMFYGRFLTCFDKIVRHSETIALTEMEPLFFIKPEKLERRAEVIERPSLPDQEPLAVDDSLFRDDLACGSAAGIRPGPAPKPEAKE